jgi:hypothetical protein
MKSKALAPTYLAITALGGVAGFASNPDHYAWTLISVVTGGLAWLLFQKSFSRKLFAGTFTTIGVLSFIIGRVYFRDHRLDGNGIFAIMVFAMLPAMIVSFCLYSIESSSGDADDTPAA